MPRVTEYSKTKKQTDSLNKVEFRPRYRKLSIIRTTANSNQIIKFPFSSHLRMI